MVVVVVVVAPVCPESGAFSLSLLQPNQRVLLLANHRLHEVRLQLQARPGSQGHRQGQIHQPTGKFPHVRLNYIFSVFTGIFALQTPTLVMRKEQKFILLLLPLQLSTSLLSSPVFKQFEVTFLINV